MNAREIKLVWVPLNGGRRSQLQIHIDGKYSFCEHAYDNKWIEANGLMFEVFIRRMYNRGYSDAQKDIRSSLGLS